jgi:hypothetical protein
MEQIFAKRKSSFSIANNLFTFINTWNYKISIGVMCIKFYINEEDACLGRPFVVEINTTIA